MNWQKHEDTCVPQKGDLNRGRFNTSRVYPSSTFFLQHSWHCSMGSWTYWSWCQGWRLDMDSETLNSTHQCWSGYDHGWKLNLLAAETNTTLLLWYRALPTQGSHLHLLHCRQILNCWVTGEAHEKTYFTAKEMWQWAMMKEFADLAMSPTILMQLTWWNNENSPLKTQLQWRLGDHDLQGWGLQKTVYILSQYPV